MLTTWQQIVLLRVKYINVTEFITSYVFFYLYVKKKYMMDIYWIKVLYNVQPILCHRFDFIKIKMKNFEKKTEFEYNTWKKWCENLISENNIFCKRNDFYKSMITLKINLAKNMKMYMCNYIFAYYL